MIVVSDTSAISNLIHINQLGLLKDLFDELIISPAVKRELFQDGKHIHHLEKQDWIRVEYPSDHELVQKLLTELDLGESESIALAKEKKADFLLIDEYLGRTIAHSLDIKIVGVLGVLILAKRHGLIEEVRIHIQALYSVGFRLNKELVNSVLKRLDESLL
jgi:predicted nucleic acid-binding protein